MSLPLTLAALLGLATLSQAGAPLDYKDHQTALNGWLAVPDKAEGKRPGVLVVHQWMGLTDYEKGRAEQIAKELGYVALAADIYGEADRPAGMEAAGKSAGKYKGDRALFRSRLKAGLDALKKVKGVDPDRLAVIGYCFGGTGALEAARADLPVLGVVSFHGGLDYADKERHAIKPKVLVLHGADDPYGPMAQVNAFEDEMKARRADCQVTLYSGAVHAFTQPEAGDDPSKGAAYNAQADQRSWRAMQAFFNEIFP